MGKAAQQAKRRRLQKTYTLAGILLFLLCMGLIVSACGAQSRPNTASTTLIMVSDAGFSTGTVQVALAKKLDIENTTTHTILLCIGKDQVCDQKAHDPKYLTGQGLRIPAGHTFFMTFNAGMYNVTIGSLPSNASAGNYHIATLHIQVPLSNMSATNNASDSNGNGGDTGDNSPDNDNDTSSSRNSTQQNTSTNNENESSGDNDNDVNSSSNGSSNSNSGSDNSSSSGGDDDDGGSSGSGDDD